MKLRTIIIVSILAILVGIYFYVQSRKPKLSFDKIDWINKTVQYSISYKGEKINEIKSLEDTIRRVQTSKDGKVTFYAESFKNAGRIQIAILNNADKTILKGIDIDYNAKTQTDITKILSSFT